MFCFSSIFMKCKEFFYVWWWYLERFWVGAPEALTLGWNVGFVYIGTTVYSRSAWGFYRRMVDFHFYCECFESLMGDFGFFSKYVARSFTVIWYSVDSRKLLIFWMYSVVLLITAAMPLSSGKMIDDVWIVEISFWWSFVRGRRQEEPIWLFSEW